MHKFRWRSYAVVITALAAMLSGCSGSSGGDGAEQEAATPTPTGPIADMGASYPLLNREFADLVNTNLGFFSAAVRVRSLEALDSVTVNGEELGPPMGGQLIGFELEDGTCARGDCDSWYQADVRVVVDGEDHPWDPDPYYGSYVIAVPEDAESVDLTMTVDGETQTISLLTGDPGEGNGVLSGPHLGVLPKFNLKEETSVVLVSKGTPNGATEFTRRVTVYSIRLVESSQWEVRSTTEEIFPADEDNALLRVHALYLLPQVDDLNRPFHSTEVVLKDEAGETYLPLIPDKAPVVTGDEYQLSEFIFFEVPKTFTNGVLSFGGTSHNFAEGGELYTVEVKVRDFSFQLI